MAKSCIQATSTETAAAFTSWVASESGVDSSTPSNAALRSASARSTRSTASSGTTGSVVVVVSSSRWGGRPGLGLGEGDLGVGHLCSASARSSVRLAHLVGARGDRIEWLLEIGAGRRHVTDGRLGIADEPAVPVDRLDVRRALVAELGAGLVERGVGLVQRRLRLLQVLLRGRDRIGFDVAVVVGVAAGSQRQEHGADRQCSPCHRHPLSRPAHR